MRRYFINLSNHPSEKWSKEQLEAAREYGEVVDVPFPNVPADFTNVEVFRLAHNLYAAIMNKLDEEDCESEILAFMIQGEPTLTYRIVQMVKLFGVPEIKCLAACSERQTVEYQNEQGATVKTSVFKFVQFREY